MSWIRALCETYDRCKDVVGEKEGKDILLPMAHSTAEAHIEIVINEGGNFLSADKVEKAYATTVIPVTEDSASRSSGIAPHPLCDKLCYIAGDYNLYVQKKIKEEYFNTYMAALQKWNERPDANQKVKAIYRYLSKKTLIRDIIESKVIQADENGYIDSGKLGNVTQNDVFVRFIVEKPMARNYTGKVWEDIELFREYESYYTEQKQEYDFCYGKGEVLPVSSKHPAKIRNTGDKAKIISANDTAGYTFRGRFSEAGQAVSIGFETSQKAHNALRWLIQKQGYRNDSEFIISWCIEGAKIPNPLEDTQDCFADAFPDEKEKISYDTGEAYADRLNKAIAGYRQNLKTNSKIVVMSVDTADGSPQGRLAITFYSELNGTEFLKNIERWHGECYWRHTYKKVGDKYIVFAGAPSSREIALSAYGTEQNGFLKADGKIEKNCIKRLLPCIVQGKKIPPDIVKAMVYNAGRPMSVSAYNFIRILSNTCAVVIKYRKERYKEEWRMDSNTETQDRSYLFGMLLAVADKAEERTYEKSDENRVTNAKRYWETFSKKPLKIWGIIYKSLVPYYLHKLKRGERKKYENLITEITNRFLEGDYSNKPLTELYLLGYAHQMEALRYKKEENIEDEGENEHE